MDEKAGTFHCVQRVAGLPEAFRTWRVTVHDRCIAVGVGRLLGGALVDCRTGEGGWEVLTDSAAVRVVVEGVEERALTFRLAEGYRLGVFAFESGLWSLAELLGEVVGELQALGGPVLGDLGIGAVQVTTPMGINTEFVRPWARIVGQWSAAA